MTRTALFSYSWLLALVADLAAAPVAVGFDGGVRAILEDRRLDSTAPDRPPGRVLIVFVGNAEAMGTQEFLRPPDAGARDRLLGRIASNEQGLHDAARRAARDLEESLARSEPTGTDEVVLAAVLDGPGVGDSAIRTVRYGRRSDRWGAVEARDWEYGEAGGLAPASGAAFELNLPRSLGRVVGRLARLGPNGFGESVAFDQILYLIKTHGCVYATEPTLRPTPDPHPLPATGIGRVLLFDAHGERGEPLASGLYGAYWWPRGGSEQPTAGAPGLMYDRRLAPLADPRTNHGREDMPDRVLVLGEAAGYGGTDPLPAGVYRLDLPIGNASRHPTLIALDSCFGSPEVACLLSASVRRSGAAGHTVVTLTGPQEVYYDLLQYGQLSAREYVALPRVLQRGLALGEPLFAVAANRLARRLADGLDDRPVRDSGRAPTILRRWCRLRPAVLDVDAGGNLRSVTVVPTADTPLPDSPQTTPPAVAERRLGWVLLAGSGALLLLACLAPRWTRPGTRAD